MTRGDLGRGLLSGGLFAARIAARSPVIGPAMQRAGAAAAEQVRETPERLVDRALAGGLTDAVGRSLAEHHVVERLAADTLAGPDVERAVAAAFENGAAERMVEAVVESPAFERLAADVTERVLASPELDRVIARVAASPALRAALAEQGAGLAEETLDGLRAGAERLDDRVERTVRRWLRRPQRAAAT